MKKFWVLYLYMYMVTNPADMFSGGVADMLEF